MTMLDEGRTLPSGDSDLDVVLVGDPASMGLMAHVDDAVVLRTRPDGGARPDGSLERALRSLRIGVVVVVAPPADEALVLRVATLRRERPGLRAMLIDGAAAPDRRLAALEAGFDEALPYQLGDEEIAGRVAIQLARARATTPLRLAVGAGVELDLEARALRRRGRFVHLRPLEFRLLEELARAPGRPLSRAWLMDRAWGAAPAAGSRTIDVHVRWLREKVEQDPDQPVHILTVRGVGYQLEPRDPDDPRSAEVGWAASTPTADG
jgi:DNA-binding response OmpR family regulator